MLKMGTLTTALLSHRAWVKLQDEPDQIRWFSSQHDTHFVDSREHIIKMSGLPLASWFFFFQEKKQRAMCEVSLCLVYAYTTLVMLTQIVI